MPPVKIEVKFEGVSIIEVLLDVKTTTDAGRLFFKGIGQQSIVDYWTTMFLQARGPRSFPLSSGFCSYDDLIFVLDRFGDGWTYAVESPPPKGKTEIPKLIVIH